MTLQARELNLIHDVLGITDSDVLARMEGFMHSERTKAHEKRFEPMSIDEFHAMIERSHADVLAGRVISLDDLRKKIAEW